MTDNELHALCTYIEAMHKMVELENNARTLQGYALAYAETPCGKELAALETELIARKIIGAE